MKIKSTQHIPKKARRSKCKKANKKRRVKLERIHNKKITIKEKGVDNGKA